MVTLNPARMLHLEERMGSVEVGKDADIVLWNMDPLSIGARCEMTFVDGVRRFDAAQDLELRKAQQLERERIITRMLAARRPVPRCGRASTGRNGIGNAKRSVNAHEVSAGR